MKKVIILSYFFPPSNAVGVHRVLRFGKALKEMGYHPIIITSKNIPQGRKDENLIELAQQHFSDVHYIDHPLDRWIANSIYNNQYGLWSKAVRFFAERFLLPEKNTFWGKAAFNLCEKLIKTDKTISFVWASMSPFTSGVVASQLTKKTGIPSIVDYRDPWTLNHYHKKDKYKGYFNRRSEKEMLKNATVVTVNNEPAKALFLEHYDIADKIHVLNNGIDESLQFIENIKDNQPNKDSYHFYHVGSFYQDRQPFTLLEAVKILEEENEDFSVAFHFVGCSHPKPIQNYVEQLHLKSKVHYKGFVAYKEAMHHIQQADILLLINGTDPRNDIFIPAKLFDYLATRKQILFLGGGQARDILTELNAGISTNHEVDNIVESLKKIIRRSREEQYNEVALSRYQAQSLVKKMLNYASAI